MNFVLWNPFQILRGTRADYRSSGLDAFFDEGAESLSGQLCSDDFDESLALSAENGTNADRCELDRDFGKHRHLMVMRLSFVTFCAMTCLVDTSLSALIHPYQLRP